MLSSDSNQERKVAAVYMRVSTTDQEDEGTIENQWIELRKRIEDDNVILPPENIYKDDGWSGSILNRPALDKLRNEATLNKFSVLYVYDRGRLSRQFIHQEIILDDLKKIGITVIELHGINGNTPEDYIMGSMMGLFHQYERTKIAERMRLGKKRIVKENKELLGYIPCYGYDLVKSVRKGENKRSASFTINQEQAKNVRYIFQLCADGNSIYQIIKQLKEDGIKAPRAKSGIWGNTTLLRMLHNTTYVGDHYYNKLESIEVKSSTKKYSRVAKAGRRTRPKSEWWHVKVPAIIDKELFNKVQEQLKKNSRYNPRNNRKNEYLLGGLVKCECGRARTGDPGPHKHLYYRCNDRESPATERVCYNGGINATVLDTKVWQTVCRLLTRPEYIAKFIAELTGDEKRTRDKLKRLNLALSKLDDEYSRYIDAYGKGILTEQKLKEKSAEISDSKISLESQKLELSRIVENKPNIDTVKFTQNMVKLLERKLSFDKKREIVRAVVDEIVASPDKAIISGKIPYYDAFISKDQKNFGERNIGFEFKNRNRRFTQCRQIHTIQCSHQRWRTCRQLSFCYH